MVLLVCEQKRDLAALVYLEDMKRGDTEAGAAPFKAMLKELIDNHVFMFSAFVTIRKQTYVIDIALLIVKLDIA